MSLVVPRRMVVLKTGEDDPDEPLLKPGTFRGTEHERRLKQAIRQIMQRNGERMSREQFARALKKKAPDDIIEAIDVNAFANEFKAMMNGAIREEVERSGARFAIAMASALAVATRFSTAEAATAVGAEAAAGAAASSVTHQVRVGLKTVGASILNIRNALGIGFDDDEAFEVAQANFGLGERYSRASLNTLTKWLKEAETGRERRRAIDRSLDHARRLQDYRAEREARTQIANAANEGREEAMRQAVAEGELDANEHEKQWTVEPGACEECWPVGGVSTPIGTTFPRIEVYHPPLHPNCRCAVELTMSDEEWARRREIAQGLDERDIEDMALEVGAGDI